MADVTHVEGDTVRDPTAHARNMVLSGLPAHAASRYRHYGERKTEIEMLLRHILTRGEDLSHRVDFARHNLLASRANRAVSAGEEKAVATMLATVMAVPERDGLRH